MDLTKFSLLELAAALVLAGLLITAVILVIRHYRIPITERTSAQNVLVLVIAGLGMLDFLMINLLGADILDPGRALTVSGVIIVLVVNLPLAAATIWAFLKS